MDVSECACVSDVRDDMSERDKVNICLGNALYKQFSYRPEMMFQRADGKLKQILKTFTIKIKPKMKTDDETYKIGTSIFFCEPIRIEYLLTLGFPCGFFFIYFFAQVILFPTTLAYIFPKHVQCR